MKKILAIVTLLFFATGVMAEAKSSFVPIKKGVKSIKINLNEEEFVIMRNQSKKSNIHSLYASTFRGTIQPIKLGHYIKTVGELEFINYMKKAQKNSNIIMVDSRTPGWYERLRIPGTVNTPHTDYDNKKTAIESMMDNFGVTKNSSGKLDFSKAKTVVAYCNGFWCGQTPGMFVNAKFSLIKMGYPGKKLKYYRGGMQAWTALGLTVEGDEK
jgi:rhodanese-related sulfurtransferase